MRGRDSWHTGRSGTGSSRHGRIRVQELSAGLLPGVVRGLVREVIDASCHGGQCLGESGRGDGRLDRAVPVDEVGVETEPFAGCVALCPQIGPEDGFDVEVIEEADVLGLDDRLSRGAAGLALKVGVLDGDAEPELVSWNCHPMRRFGPADASK